MTAWCATCHGEGFVDCDCGDDTCCCGNDGEMPCPDCNGEIVDAINPAWLEPAE